MISWHVLRLEYNNKLHKSLYNKSYFLPIVCFDGLSCLVSCLSLVLSLITVSNFNRPTITIFQMYFKICGNTHKDANSHSLLDVISACSVGCTTILYRLYIYESFSYSYTYRVHYTYLWSECTMSYIVFCKNLICLFCCVYVY